MMFFYGLLHVDTTVFTNQLCVDTWDRPEDMPSDSR